MSAFSLCRLFVLLLCAGIFAAILVLNGGTFTYTLDDPYIHLAVAEEIWRGGYGINPGEIASPSSSILFPFLLSIGTVFPRGHEYLPLALNLVSLVATLEVLRHFFLRIGVGKGWVAALLVGASTVAFHLVGLVFTGMEHNLQVALVAAVVLGLVIFLDEDRLPGWFLAAIVLAPLVRYEDLALSLSVIACIALRGRWAAAAVLAGTIVAILVAFSTFLVSHGLPFLPSSVVQKSPGMAHATEGALAAMMRAHLVVLENSLTKYPAGVLLAFGAIAGALALSVGWRRRPVPSEAYIAAVLLVVAVSHDLAGGFGWWGRYEIYALVTCAMLGAYLVRSTLAGWASSRMSRSRLVIGGIAVLIVVGFPYLRFTALAPFAANNIYEQQYTMHRFVTDYYRAPVAVNDIGWVAFQNDDYVFDLAGLASEAARTASPPSSLVALNRFIERRGIELAILYPGYFVDMPGSWQCIATLYLSREATSAGRDSVDFCVTVPGAVARIRGLLQAFQRDLPPQIRLDVR